MLGRPSGSEYSLIFASEPKGREAIADDLKNLSEVSAKNTWCEIEWQFEALRQRSESK